MINSTIWKFPLRVTDEQVISVPEGSIPLTVQFQGSELCMWVKVPDPQAQAIDQVIHVYGTGHPLPEVRRMYVGTAQEIAYGQSLVWHVFWVLRPDERRSRIPAP